MSLHFAETTHFTLDNEPALVRFAEAFARTLAVGETVALAGALGAGKSVFVRAAIAALHGSAHATSPTFTLWHHYPGPPPVEHLDLYRIEDPRELAELGLEEAFTPTSIVFVEWWRHAPELLPERRYEIEIVGAGDGPRRLALRRPA